MNKLLMKSGQKKRTEYFAGGSDVPADDPNTVKTVRERDHTPSSEKGHQYLLAKKKAYTHLLISPYEGLSPTTPQ